ncbi:hypothetical protein G3I44_16480 [Halogeometricum borinquense]|uniref:Uncharacterized protein n=1 Tax=Halogeometricum borinquense TaxID=60847 RepID=A0A6C0UJN9_9EURY|nr:hypothetical protein [Halogeometricum borinquense]QIB75736.1 hypothetical protein G3I44_16480 [Halogeometricum borinquense]
MIEVVNYTTRFRYLIQNSGSLLIGYLTAGFLAFIVSEAQPGVALIVVFGVVLGGAAYIGGTVTHRLTGDLPVFGVASVGGIVLVGLTIIVGGLTVLRAIGPLVAVSVVGVCFGSVMAWIVRNVPT